MIRSIATDSAQLQFNSEDAVVLRTFGAQGWQCGIGQGPLGAVMVKSSFSVPCDMCDRPVLAGDLQTRDEPRGFHQPGGGGLFCQRCAWIVDHIPRSIGREPSSPMIPSAKSPRDAEVNKGQRTYP